MSMVEWKKLGDIGTFENIGVDKKIVEGEPEVTLLNYVDVYKNKRINKDIPTMKVTAPLKKLQACNVLMGDIFVTPTSETKDDIGHTAVAVESLDNTVYSYHIMRYRLFQQNMTTSHYINYIFDSISVQDQIYKLASGLTRFGLSKDKFSSIIIPIPSLSEQSRIVGILDTFTASIANLKEQIGERRKQYEHYRDHLLDSVIEKKALRDIIVRSCTGATPLKSKKEYYENGAIPWLRTQEVCFNEIVCTECFITEEALHKTSVKWIPANSIIVAISGATAGRCAINKIPLTTNQHCLCLEINEKKALYKFVYYCICKQKDELIGKKEGARGDLNTSKVLSLQIANPSLEEQFRIVSILDQFEASIANLEAQLQEREKQYEHYRNQLLTF